MHSELPADAATVLSLFFISVSRDAEQVGLGHVRTHGDTTILVSGLAAEGGEVDRRPLPAVLEFSLSLKAMAQDHGYGMDVVAGLAHGALVGMPLGSSCIRYDLFGPAIAKASLLAATCEKNKIHVDEGLCTKVEQEEQLTLCVSPVASSLQPAPNSLSDVVTLAARPSEYGGRIVGSLSISSPLLRDTHQHNYSKNHVWGVEVQQHDIDETVNDDPGNSGFDPIAAITTCTLRHAEDQPKSIRMGHAAHLSLVLVLTKTCGFFTQFVDKGVETQSQAQVREDAAFSFFSVNCFMCAFLTVCWASVAQEREFSIAGDDAVPQILFFSVTGLCIVVFGATLVTRANLTTVIAVVVIINANLVNSEVDTTLFAKLLEAQAAIAEVEEQHRVQQRVLASIVPPRLHHIFENTQQLFTPAFHQLDCWSDDDMVVVHVNITLPIPLASPTPAVAPANDNSIVLPSTIESIKQRVEATAGLIETLTMKVANNNDQGLSIVQFFGGTMVIAGPIRSSAVTTAIPGQSTRHDLPHDALDRHKRGARETMIDDSVLDAVELVSELLAVMSDHHSNRHEFATPTTNQSIPSASLSGDVFKTLSCTIGVAIEQVINCLTINNNPSFELFGPAVNMAKAIADAAPALRMAVATEKFVARVPQGNKQVTFGSVESWRLRDVGCLRVRRFVHCEERNENNQVFL